ncbi:MAG TPA: RidA family protein [Propionibacteriaceae bacterium]
MRWVIESQDAPPVRAPYSPAIGAAGAFVFLSGQGPFTPKGVLVEGSFADQARQTFRNVEALVRASGGTMADVVRVGVYLRDMSRDFSEMNQIYEEFFPHPLPARTTIPTPLPRFDIEVDAVVAVPHPQELGAGRGES